MRAKIGGVIPPIVTPFDNNYRIDEENLRSITRYLLDAGVHGIVTCGSTGEFALMTLEERKTVTEVVVDEVDGRVPVIEGVTAVRTEDAVGLAKHAKDLNLTGILAAPSYYYKLEETDLHGYYASLAKVGIPIIVYNIPLTTKADLSPDFLVNLATEFDDIDYVKESTGDIHRVSEIQRLGGIEVLCGWDPLIYDFLTHKVKGWISTVSNVIPKQCVELMKLVVEKNDFEEARHLFSSLLPTIKLIDGPRFVQYAKAGLTLMGQETGPTRYPLQPLTQTELNSLRTSLSTLPS
jgi:4-hydroxy-tetrahydrodipicolinate synthase